MKRFLLLSILCLQVAVLSAQFGTATDFTVTDIKGTEHNLYEILDSGKVVLLECSATWCPPCWQLHANGYTKELYAKYGPEGSNMLEILFYEADASTNSDDLNGTGSNTLGDWVAGVPFPIIDEEVLQLDGQLYWPEGFPTLNLIRPSDREIIADMWNYDFDQMDVATGDLIDAEALLISSIEEELLSHEVTLYPNPASQIVNIDADLDIQSISVINTLGQTVKQYNTALNTINIGDLNTGEYLMRLTTNDGLIVNKKFTKVK